MVDSTPLRVLVIEDDEDTRANLRDILELDDHQVQAFSSVTEALLDGELDLISAVILDRRLPDGNAEDLIPSIRQRLPNADVIVVTGHADVESAILALQRGAADYIIKPINPDILRASLDRTSRQMQLRHEKERLQATFQELVEAVDVMVLILRADQKVLYANRFAAELTGYTVAQLTGQTLHLILDEETRSLLADQVTRLRSGRPATEQEFQLHCQDGSERWVLWTVRPLKEFEGEPAILSVGKDVTERRKLILRAMQSERLAAIGQMITGLAHESRNALQRSQACLELLKDELSDQPEPLELVERMQRAQYHLHHLYEEVRGYAAPIVLHRQPIRLDHIWQETWRNLEGSRRGRNITLQESIRATDLLCHIDPLAIDQVFRNILENAIYVSSDGDTITIECSDLLIRGLPGLEIHIRDCGPGLTPDQFERVFEPFYTTKTQGTGLGLAITQRIVEAHGGTVRVGRSQERGADIILELPLDAD